MDDERTNASGDSFREWFPWPYALLLAGLMFLCVLAAGGVLLAVEGFLADNGCEDFGASNYGDFEWSLWPLGSSCTYTEAENGVNARVGPGPTTSVWLVSLVALLAAVVYSFFRVNEELATSSS